MTPPVTEIQACPTEVIDSAAFNRRTTWPRRRAAVLAVTALALLALLAPQVVSLSAAAVSSVTAAVSSVTTASPLWLALALALAMGSMLAFALLRHGLLRSTGEVIEMRSAVSVVYSAGAVHLTMPAGALVAVGHSFRRLRELRVRPGAVTWSLAVGGVLSSAALTALALVGVAVEIGSSAVLNGLWGAAGAIAAAVVLRWFVTHPDAADRIVQSAMLSVNRVFRRPEDTGVVALRAAVAELRTVRITGAGWAGAAAAAVLNWVLDLLCLAACAAAVGAPVNPMMLLVGYTAAMAASGLSPLPAGIGVLDGALVLALAAAGASTPLALAAVLLYRVVAHGHVLLLGWSAVAARSTSRLPRRAQPAIERRPADDRAHHAQSPALVPAELSTAGCAA